MHLLGTEAYRNELAEKLYEAEKEIVVLSAFVTRVGFQWLLDRITSKNILGVIVVRWQLVDLISGASDIRVYEMAKSVGWRVFVYPELHAKTLLVDQLTVFVGSANITGYGLSVVPGSNRELGVCFSASERDLAVFNSIISESALVTDEIYKELTEFISTLPKQKEPENHVWPDKIKELFKRAPKKLWVADMFWASPDVLLSDNCNAEDKASVLHDLRLLGMEKLDFVNNPEMLRRAFLQTKSWKWLENCLTEEAARELYFGKVTASLHDALLDDPTPYRKNVKGMVVNLYAWLKYLNFNFIDIDQPGSKSERIKIL